MATGRDLATTTTGDPWDFAQGSDHAWSFGNAWVGNPAVTGGLFTGVVATPANPGDTPIIQVQFEGIAGALNFANRNGLTYPIDPAVYNRISFRMRRNREAPPSDAFNILWWQASAVAGTSD